MLSLIAATLLSRPAPLMQDFIGLNTHTVQFRPDLYRPVAKLIRNYHPVDWDLAGDPANPATFPKTHNGVDWRELYGAWKRAGFRTEASAQIESIKPEKWSAEAAFGYGETFAKYFGLSGPNRLLEAVEVGNEPVDFTNEQYRQTFEAMAKGIRRGDPKMLIAPCAIAVGSDDKYSRDLKVIEGLEPLYDVLNVHTYAFAEQWPTWRRSYPEDPSIAYLKQVRKLIDWRNRHAPGKKIWITEFGYDASTKPPPSTGDFSKWVDVSDELQALYIVRSYLLFAGLDVDRAYLFWFNDDDQPQLHGSSGLTRGYKPKPSYHAVAHLQKTLGAYRLLRKEEKNQRYVYTFERPGTKSQVIVAWTTSDSMSFNPATPQLRVHSYQYLSLHPTDEPRKTFRTGEALKLSDTPVFIWATHR